MHVAGPARPTSRPPRSRGTQTSKSVLACFLNRRLSLPVGFVIVNRILYGDTAQVDLGEVGCAHPRRFSHQHGVVGVLMRLFWRNELLGRMILGVLVQPEGRLMPPRSRIVPHGGHCDCVSRDAIPANNQQSGLSVLGAWHPAA